MSAVPSSSISARSSSRWSGSACADQRRGDLTGDVGDRAADAEAAEALAAVAQLGASLDPVERPEGTSARPEDAAVEREVDLHGRQAAAVEHLAGADRR